MLAESLIQDIRYAIRGIRRSPPFAGSVSATIGLLADPFALYGLNRHLRRPRRDDRRGVPASGTLDPALVLTDDTNRVSVVIRHHGAPPRPRPLAGHARPAHPPDAAVRLAARLGHLRAHSADSQDVLQVNQGSLYPALHRLKHQDWIAAEWRVSELGRRAKYYRLTPAGRRQLAIEASAWERMSTAIGRVMKLA